MRLLTSVLYQQLATVIRNIWHYFNWPYWYFKIERISCPATGTAPELVQLPYTNRHDRWGYVQRGKSPLVRDRTSSPPENTCNTYHALPVHTLPLPSVPCTLRGWLHQEATLLESRHDRFSSRQQRTGSHDAQRTSIHRSIDYRHHRSLKSDSPDDQLQPRDPEDTVWDTLTPGLHI